MRIIQLIRECYFYIYRFENGNKCSIFDLELVQRFTCKVGDEVRADDNVMEIETDKTTVGVPTPVSGVIEEIYVQDGDTVKAGQQLFKLKPGEVSAKPAAAAKEAPPAAAASPPPPPPPQAAAAPSPAPTFTGKA